MSPTVANVYAFNHAQRALFESRPAAGVEAADLNVDISASMASSPGKEQALRSVVASMVALPRKELKALKVKLVKGESLARMP